ncbi:MAG: hypothetical protein JO078_06270 [Candidatus Eremiobacteraeota bacterium]|nr:hypothetical protein [Candidatus Eremiobacteraeota bacterium]
MAPLLPATTRSLHRLAFAWVAIALCAACSGPNPSGSAIPLSPAGHSARHLSQSGVVVNPAQIGPQVSSEVLGADENVWFDITFPGLAKSFVQAGLTATRWPGGHGADRYHWKSNTYGIGVCSTGFKIGKPYPKSTFDNFMQDIAIPAHLDVAITVNYGSNPKCTAGDKSDEAADWVKYANVTKGYHVTWWTVGNEQYSPDSLDLRSMPHDPTQYAQTVSTDYYHKMKAASPLLPINVCVDASIKSKTWDPTVFSQATFDCVEVHFYPQKGQSVNDTFLLNNGVKGFTYSINVIKGQLSAAGKGATPIYVGEIGSALPPGDKQNMSITQALYAGQIIGEMVNDGIPRATWHSAFGDCDPPSKGGDFSKYLYGWQDFGGTMIFSIGTTRVGCSTTKVKLGTLMPTATAFEVASHFVRNGEHALGASVVGMPDIRAYASTYNGGYALMLFNLNETATENVPVTITGKTSGTGGPMWWYDKKRYDWSKRDKWKGPLSSTLASWQNSFTVVMPPWSMVVVQTN